VFGGTSACASGNQLGPMEACAHIIYATGALHTEMSSQIK